MSKKRIYEVARELGLENKQVLEILQQNNISVKNHMSSIDEATIAIVRKKTVDKAEPAKTSPVKAEQPKATEQKVERTERPVEKKSGYRHVEIAQAEKKNVPNNGLNHKKQGAFTANKGSAISLCAFSFFPSVISLKRLTLLFIDNTLPQISLFFKAISSPLLNPVKT